MNFNFWDTALLIIIPIHATILAYIHRPQLKAILSIIPLPFTLATLSLGQPLDGTNAAGILLLLFFIHSARFITYTLRFNIILAIFLSSLGYCFLGSMLAQIIPRTGKTFWIIAGMSLIAGIILNVISPGVEEPGHRSPMPIVYKWIIISCVICMLIIIKKHLLGFMTVFPMVGVVAAYELRYSLWTYCRNVHIFIVAGIPMMMAIRLTQERFGLETALVFGWVVLLLVAVPVYVIMWMRISRENSRKKEEQ